MASYQKHILFLAFVSLLIHKTLQCSSSGCCGGGNECCQHVQQCCQTSCCQRCSYSCHSCECRQKCCDTCSDKTTTRQPLPWTTTTQLPPWITAPSTGPDNPPVIPVPSNSSSVSNTVNRNDVNVTSVITLNNYINTESRITIPVNVSVVVQNNINIHQNESEGTICSPDKPCPIPPISPTFIPPITPPGEVTPTSVTSTPPCSKEVVTIKVPVPYPVPGRNKYIQVPYPYPVMVPHVPWTQGGCCTVIQPCVQYNCNVQRRCCDCECDQGFLYYPVNPCHQGCHRRSHWARKDCQYEGGCTDMVTDCSQCSEDFYQTYEGYMQCGGCFRSYR